VWSALSCSGFLVRQHRRRRSRTQSWPRGTPGGGVVDTSPQGRYYALTPVGWTGGQTMQVPLAVAPAGQVNRYLRGSWPSATNTPSTGRIYRHRILVLRSRDEQLALAEDSATRVQREGDLGLAKWRDLT